MIDVYKRQVLDASDGQFILRAAGGGEYVFRMDGAEDMVEGGVQAGQYVRIWYDGVLTDTNARNVKLLRIEAAQETQPDSLSMGSTADGVVTAFDEESITLRTAGGETYTFAAGRSVRALKMCIRDRDKPWRIVSSSEQARPGCLPPALPCTRANASRFWSIWTRRAKSCSLQARGGAMSPTTAVRMSF